MKKINIIVAVAVLVFHSTLYFCDAQVIPNPVPPGVQIKGYDVNKDGEPDVAYHSDGKYVTKVEADTDYDGKPDVTVQVKDGKFQSAEADTDHNGTMDKKFSNTEDFNKWVNENRPDFADYLNRPDWDIKLLKF